MLDWVNSDRCLHVRESLVLFWFGFKDNARAHRLCKHDDASVYSPLVLQGHSLPVVPCHQGNPVKMDLKNLGHVLHCLDTTLTWLWWLQLLTSGPGGPGAPSGPLSPTLPCVTINRNFRKMSFKCRQHWQNYHLSLCDGNSCKGPARTI